MGIRFATQNRCAGRPRHLLAVRFIGVSDPTLSLSTIYPCRRTAAFKCGQQLYRPTILASRPRESIAIDLGCGAACDDPAHLRSSKQCRFDSGRMPQTIPEQQQLDTAHSNSQPQVYSAAWCSTFITSPCPQQPIASTAAKVTLPPLSSSCLTAHLLLSQITLSLAYTGGMASSTRASAMPVNKVPGFEQVGIQCNEKQLQRD